MKIWRRLIRVVKSNIVLLTVRVSREEFKEYRRIKERGVQGIERELGTRIADLRAQQIASLKRQRLEAGPGWIRRCSWALRDLWDYLWNYTPYAVDEEVLPEEYTSTTYPKSFVGHGEYRFQVSHERFVGIAEIEMFRKITDEVADQLYRESAFHALLVEKNAITQILNSMIAEAMTPALISRADLVDRNRILGVTKARQRLIEQDLKSVLLKKLPTVQGVHYQPRYDDITVKVVLQPYP